MQKIPRILLVGSNARKAGKTTIICKILEKFSSSVSIIAVKISTDSEHKNIEIREDFIGSALGDTGRMLDSGAVKAFRIYTPEESLQAVLSKILVVAENSLIICESTHLRKIAEPGLFILAEKLSGNEKPYYNEIKNTFPYIKGADFDPEKIQIQESGHEKKWIYNE